MDLLEVLDLPDDELQIKVAELDGWYRLHTNSRGLLAGHKSDWGMPSDPCLAPDYCNDLNAMHEVESKLADKQRCSVRKCLVKMSGHAMLVRAHEWIMFDATVKQRAIAFVVAMTNLTN